MMKPVFFALGILLFSIFGCDKEEVTVPEDQQIENYLKTKNLTVTEKTSTGLRFILTEANSTGASTAQKSVTVKYLGKLLSDKQFDSGQFTFTAGKGEVVRGFDEGVVKMKVGEKATFIFPSSLGYGSTAVGTIPANSPLVFNVEIISVNN